jgi:hypothetical protein
MQHFRNLQILSCKSAVEKVFSKGKSKMRRILVFGLFCLQSLFANASLDRYFSYMQQIAKSNGNFREGEIEIITNPEEIARVQKAQESRLLTKGFSPADAAEFTRIGVVNEGQYWIWLRDAVYFPKGIPGTYDRLLWKSELQGNHAGVAVLPVTEYFEAIAGTVSLTKEEVHEGLAQGFLEVSINGQKKQVSLRDAFLTFALLQAQVRRLF